MGHIYIICNSETMTFAKVGMSIKKPYEIRDYLWARYRTGSPITCRQKHIIVFEQSKPIECERYIFDNLHEFQICRELYDYRDDLPAFIKLVKMLVKIFDFIDRGSNLCIAPRYRYNGSDEILQQLFDTHGSLSYHTYIPSHAIKMLYKCNNMVKKQIDTHLFDMDKRLIEQEALIKKYTEQFFIGSNGCIVGIKVVPRIYVI